MSIESVINQFRSLNKDQQESCARRIESYLHEHIEGLKGFRDTIVEARFADGRHCPRCGSVDVKRWGAYSDKNAYMARQRYMCKDCGRTFTELTGTPMAGTHKPELWSRYIRCMIEGLSLPRTAKRLKISVPTAFYWRHKILRALKALHDRDILEGIVEMDETFFVESNKGSRNLKHRPPRKHRGVARKRGISNEQVAVLVGISRDGDILSRAAGRGRLSADQVARAVGGNLMPDSTLVTDSMSGFTTYAKREGLRHVRLNSRQGVYTQGVHHIQHVNNYHAGLKEWMRRFCGVASKFLDHYMAWFNLLRVVTKLESKSRLEEFYRQSCRKTAYTPVRDFREFKVGMEP
ncbi:IS1595 family transposase [Desulfocurvus sp.]|uniref:IS1595 family transposase n=1 Tax=Desulfocurvus sp. TaxID=2871698 RepID=UPI0025BF0099|nr:IS1595 family transposase [Desulfocurvus sp.]MCK9240548.1 IS1595 family transposase [Desulfocurvus sp.]